MSAVHFDGASQRSALRSWQTLAFICVLVVLLGSLLWSAREAQAQKPDKAPSSGNPPGNQHSAHNKPDQHPSPERPGAGSVDRQPDSNPTEHGSGRSAESPAAEPRQQPEPPGKQNEPLRQQPEPPTQQPEPYYQQPAYTGLDQKLSDQQPVARPVSQLTTSVEPVGQPVTEPVDLSEPVGWSTAEPAKPDMPVEQLTQKPVQPGESLGEMSKPFEESTRPAQEVSITQELSVKLASLTLKPVRGTVNSVLERISEMVGSYLDLLAGILAGVQSVVDLEGGGPPGDTSPFSPGGSLPVGSALSSLNSSSNSVGPLLAVLALFLIALLHRGRFWDLYKVPKPSLVPQLTPERPD